MPAAGSADDEPPYLAAQQGAFELARCAVRDGGDRICTEQEAAATPEFWHSAGSIASTRYPYAVIGAGNWANYKVSADVLLPGIAQRRRAHRAVQLPGDRRPTPAPSTATCSTSAPPAPGA